MVEALVKAADTPLDCHLMIADPDRWAPAYVEAGAGSVTFHVEAATAPIRLARELRAKGARAGMALRPATPVEPYEDLLGELDMLLIMTVEPGFGGQRFLEVCVPKFDVRGSCWTSTAWTCGSRSTAASPWRRSQSAPRPAPTRSSPAQRCSRPRIRLRWSTRSGQPPPGAATRGRATSNSGDMANLGPTSETRVLWGR